jgi:hypothetical protein
VSYFQVRPRIGQKQWANARNSLTTIALFGRRTCVAQLTGYFNASRHRAILATITSRWEAIGFEILGKVFGKAFLLYQAPILRRKLLIRSRVSISNVSDILPANNRKETTFHTIKTKRKKKTKR